MDSTKSVSYNNSKDRCIAQCGSVGRNRFWNGGGNTVPPPPPPDFADWGDVPLGDVVNQGLEANFERD